MQPSHVQSTESVALELAGVFLDAKFSDEQAWQHALSRLGTVTDDGELVKLHALVQAHRAMRLVLLGSWKAPHWKSFTDEQLRTVRAVGWPRATRLAEMAWAWARVYFPDSHAEALALLQAQQQLAASHPEAAASDPLLERVWLPTALAALYSVAGDHNRALDCGLQSEQLAARSGHDLVLAKAAQALAFVYLSTGDVEGACAVLPPGIAAAQRHGTLSVTMLYNHLLSLVLSRRLEAAAQLVGEWPILRAQASLADFPSLKALVARVRLGQGRLDEAADLPPWGWQPGVGEPHTMAANRLWASADVLLGLGRPQDARNLLAEGLKTFAEAGVTLSPLNATQCYRALADACEALSDLPAALAALRQSQAACFAWVGQSMRARLQALHFSAPAPVPGPLQKRQALRLQLVEKALATAQQQADGVAAAQERSNLLTQVTHEVRNPLHGVVWMTSMLMMSDLDDRQREYLQLANSSARMALSLCNDVLDLAKLDAGRFSLNPSPVDLRALVADCTKVFEAPARAKGLQVHWHCDGALPSRLQADRLRLQQVLMNLLSNATKFTHKGRVDVGLLWLGADAPKGEPTVRLSVTDTGPGLPADLIPRLFQEFEQASPAPPQAAGGAGLGLALCRQLVRMMGGEIGVNNRPGQGCTFWCLMPLPAV